MSKATGLLPWKHSRLIAVLLLPALMSCARPGSDDLPDIILTGIPDLAQQGPDFGLPGDGRALCAPVAVSNSLSWLAGGMSRDEQIALVVRTSYQTLFPASVLIELRGARTPNEKRAYIDGALILDLGR
jgi:hypothetical protein